MTDYTALINQWPLLTPGTTAAKLAQINAMTVTGSVPTSFTISGTQILNCINWAEFAALTAAQQANVLALCNNPGQILGGSGNVTHIAPGMIVAYFPVAGPTIAALTALAQGTVQPWWQANGYTGPFTAPDLVKAGNLT